MLKIGLILISFLIINSCQSNKNIKKEPINIDKSSDKSIYNSLYQKILTNNFDDADNLYIELKNNFENSKYLNLAALNLAIAHMTKKEYILTNFYLQQYLSANSYDEFAKYLLSKNQFLSAVKNSNDTNYLNRALKSLNTNKNLLSSSDYILLNNSMINRIKIDLIKKNSDIQNLYKRLNKKEAVELYNERIRNFGIKLEDIK